GGRLQLPGTGTSRLPSCRIKRGGGAMVQTSPTSHADQAHVPGATAVRVLGVLLVLQGGWKLYSAINATVQVFAQAINARPVVFFLVVSGAIGLSTIIAGVLLVRHRAGKVFGLVICSIALAHQLLTLISLYAFGRSPMLSLGMVFLTVSV